MTLRYLRAMVFSQKVKGQGHKITKYNVVSPAAAAERYDLQPLSRLSLTLIFDLWSLVVIGGRRARYRNGLLSLCQVSAIFVLSCGQTEAHDRYTHATTVGVSKDILKAIELLAWVCTLSSAIVTLIYVYSS